jgi:hypothetical protein
MRDDCTWKYNVAPIGKSRPARDASVMLAIGTFRLFATCAVTSVIRG